MCNQGRFLGKKTLFVTGERAQESAARARYKTFEPHRTNRRDGTRRNRYVDHWRPIHVWDERQVWEIIERHRVAPHPAYDAGFGRVSRMNCIFASPRQLSSIVESSRSATSGMLGIASHPRAARAALV
ncbi:phosphoadenosine phosphosulfate reductase domain-containing protein [Microvirga lotononidis]|uniref:phosphoadenosine phosphosulfate reductase domain-containing protein n=1 Tax=Microvirga lotononidis TaxID=864069 RepID=UPI002AF6B225|nr:phosphoadenosine phosphosulfate reductase family protein [Microvirga lotononidis]